jgi:hypothetical protein
MVGESGRAGGHFTPVAAPAGALSSPGEQGRGMAEEDHAKIAAQLVELKVEHRDLDEAIARLAASIQSDELSVKRLKKRKLKIKDLISALESRLIPDLDA